VIKSTQALFAVSGENLIVFSVFMDSNMIILIQTMKNILVEAVLVAIVWSNCKVAEIGEQTELHTCSCFLELKTA